MVQLREAERLYGNHLNSAHARVHTQNAERLAKEIARRVAEGLSSVPPAERPRRLAADLYGLLTAAQLDASIYAPRDSSAVGGYGKYLLYTDDNAGSPYCLQLFVFDPRQQTPIHDHPCECAAAVFLGEIEERRFELENGALARMCQDKRAAGSVGVLEPDQPNIHSLKNASDARAVSVHLYLIDGVDQRAAVKNVFSPARMAAS